MGRAEAEKFVKEQIDSNFIVVFSKTYCPYCTMAKEAGATRLSPPPFFMTDYDREFDAD